MRERQFEHEQRMKDHERWYKNMEINLSEMTDKLNGLIG